MASATQISRIQTSIFTGVGSMSSPAESPVSHTVLQENEKEQLIVAISGLKCSEQLGKFAPDGSFAKTFTDLLTGQAGWYSSRSKLTWKLKATKSLRIFCQLAVLTRHIAEREYGLLPTPLASEIAEIQNFRKTTMEGFKKGWLKDMSLTHYLVAGLLPTPTTNDKLNNPETKSQMNRANLAGFLSRHVTGQTGQLNPPFVEEMMGYPVNWTSLLNRSTEHTGLSSSGMP